MIEDLAAGAVNIALQRARELAEADLAQVTGGLPRAARDVRGLGGVFASPIARLIQQLAKLPGIGEKTAARLAFHILRAAPEDAAALAAAIGEVRQKIRFCSICCDLTEADPCAICRDPRRDAGLVCVVAQPQDLIAIERAGGLPRPLPRPARRCSRPSTASGRTTCASPSWSGAAATGPVQEAILATSPSVEGEATAVYLAKLLRPLGVRATRIATGVPMGGELEYADQATLARAIDGRREM